MVIHVITAAVNPGKFPQMMEWSGRAIGMVKENHDREISLLRNVTGPGNEFHFMTTHDSLAEVETYMKNINTDEQFQALIAEAWEQELWGSTRTSMYRSAM